MSQGSRTAPAGRLQLKRLMDSIFTKLSAGTNTNLDADRTTGSLTTTNVTRSSTDPYTIDIRLPDGTRYRITGKRV